MPKIIESIASGGASRFIDGIMSKNVAVLTGYLEAAGQKTMTNDETRGLPEVLSTLAQNRGARLRKPKGKSN